MTAKLKNNKLKESMEFSDRKQRIHDFLAQHPIGVMSSVDSNCEPHGVVIYFTIDKGFVISFLTKSGTRKYDNLKHHDHIMLTVYESKTQTTAQINGTVHEINEPDKINEVAKKILKNSLKTSKSGVPPISKLEAGSYVAFEIDPAQIRMAVYDRPKNGDYTDMFESLESYELHDLKT